MHGQVVALTFSDVR